MEDRIAPRRRPLTQGVPAQPKGAIPLENGIPLEQGVLKGPESVHGIPTGPMITREMRAKKEQEAGEPIKCIALTKAGKECQAWAVKDQPFCVGHKR